MYVWKSLLHILLFFRDIDFRIRRIFTITFFLPFFKMTSAQASLSHRYSTRTFTHPAPFVCPSWRRTRTGGPPSPSNRSAPSRCRSHTRISGGAGPPFNMSTIYLWNLWLFTFWVLIILHCCHWTELFSIVNRGIYRLYLTIYNTQYNAQYPALFSSHLLVVCGWSSLSSSLSCLPPHISKGN